MGLLRRGALLKRSTPLRAKAATPKRKRPPLKPCTYAGKGATIQRCARRPVVRVSDDERYCDRHATWIAGELVGDFVKARDGHRCQIASFNDRPCIGSELYACHLIPKGRYPVLRYEPDNITTGCMAHHKAFDEAPLEKEDWCRAYLGERYEELRRQAIEHPQRPDRAAVIIEFRERLSA